MNLNMKEIGKRISDRRKKLGIKQNILAEKLDKMKKEMSDEQIEKLNHVPHYMVCDTNVDGQQHGLGLLIVRQIIEGHGGAMTISRGTYGGFQVTLTIPCEKITHLS